MNFQLDFILKNIVTNFLVAVTSRKTNGVQAGDQVDNFSSIVLAVEFERVDRYPGICITMKPNVSTELPTYIHELRKGERKSNDWFNVLIRVLKIINQTPKHLFAGFLPLS